MVRNFPVHPIPFSHIQLNLLVAGFICGSSGLLLALTGLLLEDFDLAEIFEAVGDGDGAVHAADLADAVGPDGMGEVRPVVIASFQLVPTGLEVLLPFRQPEELPER